MIVAEIVTPEHGEAFVGMQGDMWDAQKDSGLAGIGAALTMGYLRFRAGAVQSRPE
jgi:putative membrane protein